MQIKAHGFPVQTKHPPRIDLLFNKKCPENYEHINYSGARIPDPAYIKLQIVPISKH